MKLFTDL